MAHGKPISVDFARTSIQNFITHQQAGQNPIPPDKMVVGHRFDLVLLKEFILEIDKLIQNDVEIDSIRFYHGMNKRNGRVNDETPDLIIIPTLKNGDDYSEVYFPIEPSEINPLILGESTPCPNVCQNKTANCTSEST